MKRKVTILIIVFVVPLVTFGQPPITHNVANFLEKSTYILIRDSINPNPIPTGKSVVWDFSNIDVSKGDSFVIEGIDTSNSAIEKKFPLSNQIVREARTKAPINEIHHFYYKDTTVLMYHGRALMRSFVVIPQRPPLALLRFPMSFNDQFTDTFGAIIKYDGFGTLKLPSGTFHNVYRTKTVRYPNTPILKSYRYEWFAANRKLLSINVENGTWQTRIHSYASASVFEPHEIINIYPNPNNGVFYLNCPIVHGNIEVYSLAGTLVYKADILDKTTEIKLRDKGLYLVKTVRGNHRNTQIIQVD